MQKWLIGWIFLLGSCPAVVDAHWDVAKLWHKKCATCHGSDAKGSEMMARSLSVRPEALDLSKAETRAKSDATLYRIIHVGNWKMPGFSNQMGQKKEQAILEYLRRLQDPPPPDVLPMAQ